MTEQPSDPNSKQDTSGTPVVAHSRLSVKKRGSCLVVLVSLGGWGLFLLTLIVLGVLLWTGDLKVSIPSAIRFGGPRYEVAECLHIAPEAAWFVRPGVGEQPGGHPPAASPRYMQ